MSPVPSTPLKYLTHFCHPFQSIEHAPSMSWIPIQMKWSLVGEPTDKIKNGVVNMTSKSLSLLLLLYLSIANDSRVIPVRDTIREIYEIE